MEARLDVTVRGRAHAPVLHRLVGVLLRIGRDPSNELALADASASRFHAELRHENGQWHVLDLGSHNGTMVNGRKLAGQRPVSPGDQIVIGGLILTIQSPTEPLSIEGRTATAVAPGREAKRGHVELLGESPLMRAVRGQVQRFAGLDAPVLVTGESGTGKELVARLIHDLSPRAERPFVIVNCPALPGSLLDAELFGVEKGVATGVEPRVGRLEMAAGGTIFLDEVADLELAAQARLLRFIQDGMLERIGGRTPIHVDARIVSATHRDLEEAMAKGSFRADLFHRLGGVVIKLPSLRQRREDIAVLAESILERCPIQGKRLAGSALRALEAHDYPGNVRELEKLLLVGAATAAGAEIEEADLPDTMRLGAPLPAGDVGAARLLSRILAGESFWDVVHGPFLRRELSREVVMACLELARAECGESWKGVVKAFRIEGEYRRFVNFLTTHALR